MGVAHRAEIIVDHVVSVPVQGELRNGHKDVGCLLQRMLICAHCCLNLTDTQFGGTSTNDTQVGCASEVPRCSTGG